MEALWLLPSLNSSFAFKLLGETPINMTIKMELEQGWDPLLPFRQDPQPRFLNLFKGGKSIWLWVRNVGS